MRILHVIPAIAPRYGGPSRAVVDMCQALTRLGFDTLVATTDADGAHGRLPVAVGRPTDHRGVSVVFFGRQVGEAFKYSAPLARWVTSHVRRFDVVHIHGVFSHACLVAGRACRRGRVPYVVRPLGSLDPWSLRQKRWRKRLLWQLGVRRMIDGAAVIHYTTAEERRLAERALAGRRGVVIPLGVDDEVFWGDVEPGRFRRRYPSLGEAPYVLVLSRLHPKKGLESLVQAFLALGSDERFRRWRLVVAGNGEPAYAARLQDLVEALRGADRVLFAGWVDGPDRVAAYRDAALAVLPSLQENFALSAAEAMASGLPVIVSERVNLAEDIWRARAGWVTGLGPAALQSVLRTAMGDDEERKARGEAGRALASARFTWPVVARQLGDLYRMVASGGDRVGVA
jgi:glycosyltransferase involved in cell wall biosynthesis